MPRPDGENEAAPGLPAGEVTRLLAALRGGDGAAAARLVDVLYEDLRRLARRQLGRPRGTLGPTAVVHEAYLKLFDRGEVAARDRAHFLAIASRAMRQVVVDYARTRQRQKRGGGVAAVPIEAAEPAVTEEVERVLGVDRALERLRRDDARLVDVVECRFFGGLSEPETAEALGLSLRSVQRLWHEARKRLRSELAR